MSNKESKKKCFVITPIGEENSSIRRHINGIIRAAIRPALEDKYEVRAAHEITSLGSINNQVITSIYTADLVIANLTDLNPNVMYELAFRHALKKPVITIMEKGTKALPFDIGNERTLFYVNDSQGVLDLKEAIIDMEKTLENSKVSNPIYDALVKYIDDENVMKNIEPSNTTDTSVLKAILNKINDLGDTVNNLSKEALATVDDNMRLYTQINLIGDISKNKMKEVTNEICNEIYTKFMGFIKAQRIISNNYGVINVEFNISRLSMSLAKSRINEAIPDILESSTEKLECKLEFKWRTTEDRYF